MIEQTQIQTQTKPQTHSKFNLILGTGLAIFTMFFGAGNVVFPLALGQQAQDKTPFAILGLLITAVCVPIAGVMAMTLFNGNYKEFFGRIGKVPGFLIAFFIMGLIGPFGAMPRCIALSFSTIKMYFPVTSLPLFSFIACIVIFLMTFRKNKLLDILGYTLTPILLFFLAVIIVLGFINSPSAPIAEHSGIGSFLHGLKEGYQTMDLLGAFFFSGIVLACLKKDEEIALDESHDDHKALIKTTLLASSIGGFLLAMIYIGFSYVASFNSDTLAAFKQDELIGELSRQVLGPYAGIVACAAVALACITTAVALGAVFADYFRKEVCKEKISYHTALIGTLAATFFVSTLNFRGIVKFLAPILEVCYPALIVLCLLNIAYKLFKFEPVKAPVAIVFGASLLNFLLNIF